MKKEKSEQRYNVWYLLRDRKVFFFFANIVNVLATASSVGASLLFVNMIQTLFAKEYESTFITCFIILGLYSVFDIFGFWFEILKNNMIRDALIKYRNAVSLNLQRESESTEIDTYISALNNDSKQVESALNCFFNTIDSLTAVIIAFLGLIKLHYLIAASAVVLFIINIFTTKIFKNKTVENEKNRSEILKEYYSETSDEISGYDVWNLYNAKGIMRDKLENINKKFEDKMYGVHNWTAVFIWFPNLFSSWAQELQMIFLVILISKGIVVPGTVLSVGNLSGKFFNGIMTFLQEVVQINGYNSIIDNKMKSIRELDEQRKDIDKFDFSVRGLTFSYGKNSIFDNFNLNFKYGGKYIIVGSSGSGKSTLSNILSKKIKEYDGSVFLGDENINDINDYTLHSYVGFMTQKPYIFSTTIRDNITLGRAEGGMTAEDVAKSAYINEFTDNLDEEIENNGENLSGGQLQRIAIARELYSPHPVIILDEAVSALDKNMTEKILERLLSLKSTVILIAHRLHEDILSRFDEVIDIDELK